MSSNLLLVIYSKKPLLLSHLLKYFNSYILDLSKKPSERSITHAEFLKFEDILSIYVQFIKEESTISPFL